MATNSAQQGNSKNYPSFKMKLAAGEDVYNFYKQRLGSNVDVNSTFAKFKDSFEECTKDFKGPFARLIIDQESMGKPEMILVFRDGHILRAKNQSTWVLANEIQPDKYSLQHAVYCIHKIYNDNGFGKLIWKPTT